MSVTEGVWSCPRCQHIEVRSGYQDREQWQTYLRNVQASHGPVCARKASVQ
jgi:ribosomal protein L37AE/L43A